MSHCPCRQAIAGVPDAEVTLAYTFSADASRPRISRCPWVLPLLRAPVAAIYWLPAADDMTKAFTAERLRQLDRYRRELAGIAVMQPRRIRSSAAQQGGRHLRFAAPLLGDLLDAFTQDLSKTRYASSLNSWNIAVVPQIPWAACAHAENPAATGMVGRHLPSLQLINHWQDIGSDYARGWIYLLQEDCAFRRQRPDRRRHGGCQLAPGCAIRSSARSMMLAGALLAAGPGRTLELPDRCRRPAHPG